MLANVSSNNLSVLRVGMSEDVLNQIVAVLVARNIDEGNPRTVDTSLANAVQVAAEELNATNLEALLNDLGSKLIHRVLRSVSNYMVNGTTTVRRGTMLTNVLDAPVTELTMGDNVDVGKDLLNTRTLKVCVNYVEASSRQKCTHLVLLQAVLKDILNNQATSLSQGNLMPHPTESFIDKLHDLGRTLSPPQFKQLLPDVTGISMNDCLRDAAKQFVDHNGLVILGDRVKCLLNNVTTKGVH